MRIKKIMALFVLLLPVGCGTKKETERYVAQLRQKAVQRTEEALWGHKMARSALTYTETAVRLSPPDTAGFQAVESVVCSRMDFIRHDSLDMQMEKKELALTSAQVREEREKEKKQTAPGVSVFWSVLLIGVLFLGFFFFAKRRT